MNDIDLWRSFRDGDDASFAMLYRNYIDVLYKYGHKLSTDTQLVEDSIQDMFIELWNGREKLSDTDSIKYYLFRVLRRKITQHPLHRSWPDTDITAATFEDRLYSMSAESQIINSETESYKSRMINKALLQLPPRQQEVVNLRYFHNFGHQQIAEIMSISVQSVHNTLQKSMKGLREVLSDYADIIFLIISFLFY